ncbi:hypothetical protein OG21DRAFT_1509378 [Imleria badia]|nr:hypothetical protein OG21DRAFT_1509378 [Imleria badia]
MYRIYDNSNPTRIRHGPGSVPWQKVAWRSCLDFLQEPYIVVQAFTVPDSQHPVESGKGLLRLSHEGVYSTRKWPFAVIRNSVVDPTTGAIRVRLLEHDKYDGFISTCATLTLDTPGSLDDVSPLFIDEHHILARGNVPFKDDLYYDDDAYYDVSDDGYARGLFTRDPDPDRAAFGVMKFTIDATQDRCVAVLSGFSRAREWVDIVAGFDRYSWNPYVCLDGVRGRLSYIGKKNKHDGAVEEGNIVVVEVA